MWNPPAALQMQKAAKAAGIPLVELVFEPQCAAAYFTHNIGQILPEQLLPGQILSIADVGGGTGDFVSYKVMTECSSGASVGLKLARPSIGRFQCIHGSLSVLTLCIGSLCGSEFVNEQFRDYLRSDPEQLQRQCDKLKISKELFLKRASADFEKNKLDFVDPSHLTDFFLVVKGDKGSRNRTDIELTR